MSSIPRLFVNSDLVAGTAFALDEEQAKYLTRVMRLGLGDGARVFNGRDGEWRAEISEITGRRAEVTPVEQLREQPSQGAAPLTLLFAPVKKSETDFIVEKATELGAGFIQPVITERTQSRTVRLDRFEKIALEAAEQTERLDLPLLADALGLDAALAALPEGTALIFCDEAGDEADAPWGGQTGRAQPMADVVAGMKGQSAAILIGPEGGFSPAERGFLRAREGTHPVSLGPRILRAETAAVAAMTLWQAICGDWA
ncbi:MAG: 16S rRNA (uracil(1498)-N(3))-methyltransferase [Alphaproteobacteria bacterium]|nr:16S rRNA (uracil(1498)-N(3))-methyltransferase [Alphaproteobacteria bacterium]MBU2142933.1 16S rRNA (uracil(1498)-N(3))-methyltransferase [Alphaproteobacteria bacterium]MBU2197205.1 16S rRNA (uracil(1498)-N(3))-methyltransferase [Alphaproteobacteria bacterium]